MQVILYSQRLRPTDVPYVSVLLDKLEKERVKYAIYAPFHELLIQEKFKPNHIELIHSYEDIDAKKYNMVLSLGGDGTILHATTLVRSSGIPIAGINLGRLGFLATIEKARIEEALDFILSGKYEVQARSMIQLDSDQAVFGDQNFALNDFTIHKRDDSSMIIIHTYIGDRFLNSYWADGLVVSTPTGSTGYNLSGGGPIIFPLSSNFAITPIAPHNLNVRPLVISDKESISFQIEGRDRNYLITLDSRSEKITSDIKLTVRKCDWHTYIVILKGQSFIKTIHDKLLWGLDSRN